MERGFIKIHRKMLDWEWWDDNNTFKLFIHLILIANHKDKKYRGKLIKKGQIMTGREKLAESANLTVQQTRTSLDKLKLTNEITIETSRKGTVITITNWDKYQVDNQQSNQQVTNNQPTSNQQVTTNKNGKKDKNGKNKEKKLKEKKEIFSRFEFIKNFFLENYGEYPDDLQNSIREHMEIRDKQKCSKTERAVRQYCESILKITDELKMAKRMIDQSSDNGWKGVFKLSEKKKTLDEIFESYE